MSEETGSVSEPAAAKGFKFPTAYTILFCLIIVVAGATWIIPAGQYDRDESEALGREVPVPGTYKEVEANPQDVFDVFLAPIAGFYDPGSYEAMLSLEDDLLKKYLPRTLIKIMQRSARWRVPVPWKAVMRLTQMLVERHHARQRRNLVQMDQQLKETLAFSGPLE